ncbi:MAG: hypothetical protein KDA65_11270 [Planctomycetaceae bacterium]|nr:hypothetical protein [Planctomycetaceae bacterium]
MAGILLILAIVCFIGCAVSELVIVVRAFQESVLWGLAVLFIPFAIIVFLVKFWDRCKQPFLYGLGAWALGVVFILLGSALNPQ